MRDRVRYVEGIPDWFVYALHLWYRRRCRKIGHEGNFPGGPIYTCVHCGQIVQELK